MAVSALSVGAYAKGYDPEEGVMPMYDSASNVLSTITAKNKTATCTSSIMLRSNEKWSTVTQTIEQQSTSGNWSSTSYTWSKNADNQNRSYSFSNSATLSSGTYRLRSDVTIILPNGTTETVTNYSSAISI